MGTVALVKSEPQPRKYGRKDEGGDGTAAAVVALRMPTEDKTPTSSLVARRKRTTAG